MRTMKSVYVECCQRQVPVDWARPGWFGKATQPLYLCREGFGCLAVTA